MKKLPGITREEEEQKLGQIIDIAQQKLEATKQNVQALADELHEMLEVFDENDKEAMAMWHNTDARFKQVNQDVKRAEQARKKPYFGRIDFKDKNVGKDEVYYIGRSVIAENPAEPEVIDWRAPIAGVYYDSALGDVTYSVKGEGRYEITLSRKRTYEIRQDTLQDFYDSDVVANDELLTKYLAKNKRAVLGEIIATIQREQNEVIRKKPRHNMIIQGAAGSGKTTVAMHRISYILYNYELEFAPEDFYIIGSNQVLLNYITGVLPELNVYGVSQMTMEQLFVRLLYEDWDKHKYTVKSVQRGVTSAVKGTLLWFRDLEDFCLRYEQEVIPGDDVRIEKNGVVLLTAESIKRILKRSRHLSRADKITKLTEHLMAKLENELSGKYYSYTREEKARLTRRYETHFGKREWKGSLYEMYDSFLLEQNAKGFQVDLPGTEFDVYDLAALAYLYKRIKETEIIREAGHVVIDEAQDFGMMVYGALKYCLSKCTYTIMGDVSQNISLDYGLNDWRELRKLMLAEEFDYFGLLRKSYRNTIEIAEFATDILCHGSFQIYPVEPIIRHGNPVRTTACADLAALLAETAATVTAWLQKGLETIAIVCANEEEVRLVSQELGKNVSLVPFGTDQMEFAEGVMVLTLEYTKGLEFDAVLLFDASRKNYPLEDGYAKRLYVATTRALHELVVLYQGELTKLIADPVPESKKQNIIIENSAPKRKSLPAEPEKTNAEMQRQQALEGEWEMAQRNLYGPRRIVVNQGNPICSGSAKATGNIRMSREAAREAVKPKEKETVFATVSDKGVFGEMPDNHSLRPAGHPRIDCAVRFVMKGNGHYDIFSSYGTLRIVPLEKDLVRICFAKGQCDKFPEPIPRFAGKKASYKVRESVSCVELMTEQLTVRIDRKTGMFTFLNAQGKVLLAERVKEPRQIGEDMVWEFFDWKKDEALIARGLEEGELLRIGNSARYISFTQNTDRIPALASSKGYELLFPPKDKILCCNIPMYGPYVSVEGEKIIDFYFRVK